MAVSDKLVRLNQAKEDLQEALETPSEKIETYANLVEKYVSNQPLSTSTGTCENALDVPCKEFVVEGNSYQYTTTGKNLFKVTTPTSASNGITTTFDGKKYITLKGTATSTWANITSGIALSLEAGTYTISTENLVPHTIAIKGKYDDDTIYEFAIASNSKSRTFTTTTPIATAYFYIGGITSGTTYNETITIQLEKGSSATTYEPYTGGIASPNPSYPQAIEVVKGKNLFDYTTMQNQAVDSTTGAKPYSSSTRLLSDYITLRAGTYTFSYSSSSKIKFIGYYMFDNNGAFTSRVLFDDTTGSKTYTFDEEVKTRLYFMLTDNSNISKDLFSTAQLEKGDTATTYLPYNTIEIEQRGKNLWNGKINTSTSGGITVTQNEDNTITINGRTNSAHRATFSNSITYKPNTTYTAFIETISGSFTPYVSGSNWAMLLYVTSQKNIALVKTSTTWLSTFTTSNTSETPYFWFGFGSTSTETDAVFDNFTIRIMVVEGTYTSSTIGDYEPYQTPQTYQIPLGENYLAKVGSVQDKLVISRNGKCKISKNINGITFIGASSEEWFTTIDTHTWGIPGTNYKKYSEGGTCICNYYPYIEPNKANSVWIGNGSFVFMNNQNISSLTDFKTWLSTNKPIVYYQLATPSEIELDNVEIEMFEGTNIFSLVSTLDTTLDIDYITKVD